MPAYLIVQAPSHLGLRAPGVEALPEALLAAGLAERLGARAGERLAAPAFDPEIDPRPGCSTPATCASTRPGSPTPSVR
ncbi:MAG TPA: hypothetical protein VG035_02560, partial [Actinomycetota bacterium]|nr:hypothetical protein [Actinomycetota bacterium]